MISEGIKTVLIAWGVMLLSLFFAVEGIRKLKSGEWNKENQGCWVITVVFATVVTLIASLVITVDTLTR